MSSNTTLDGLGGIIHQNREAIVENELTIPVDAYQVSAGIITHDNGREELYADIRPSKDAPETYRLTGSPLRRYLHYLGLKKQQVWDATLSITKSAASGKMIESRLPYVADNMIRKSCRNPKFGSFKLEHVHGDVRRITSNIYSAVSTDIIQETIRNRIKEEGHTIEQEQTTGPLMTYVLGGQVWPGGIRPAVHVNHKNDGLTGFKMYTGGHVQICSNGLVAMQELSRMRINHRWSEDKLARKIDQELGLLMAKMADIPRAIAPLQKEKITLAVAKKRIDLMGFLPFVANALKARLTEPSKLTQNGKMDWDGTMFGVYMAGSFLGSRNLEFSTVSAGKRRITPNAQIALTSISTYTQDWDAREKEMDRILKENDGKKAALTKLVNIY